MWDRKAPPNSSRISVQSGFMRYSTCELARIRARNCCSDRLSARSILSRALMSTKVTTTPSMRFSTVRYGRIRMT